jgi:hypothetical protein
MALSLCLKARSDIHQHILTVGRRDTDMVDYVQN